MIKASEFQKRKTLSEYRAKRDLYCDFTSRLKATTQELLELEKVNYVAIEARTKTEQSLEGKLDKNIGTSQNLADIQDLSGVRVITLVTEDIIKIEDVLRKFLDLVPDDVNDRLGEGEVGYRSNHYLVSFNSERIKLPEYSRFSGLVAEVQVRTVLQHAWAQIGHDQVYKASSSLPERMTRDFRLLSGLLEIADNEFNRISAEIQNLEARVEASTASGNLDIDIDSISLRQYLETKFDFLRDTERRFGPNDDMTEEIIKEFKGMGMYKLQDIDSSITPELLNVLRSEPEHNFSGISRSIMYSKDWEKYFGEVWDEKWVWGPGEAQRFSQFIDVDSLFSKHPTLDGHY